MNKSEIFHNHRLFYHVYTALICLGVLLTAGIVLLVSYVIRLSNDPLKEDAFKEAYTYNQEYFSDRILKGVTVSGIDVGGMSKQEAKTCLATNVDYDIKTRSIVFTYGDRVWTYDKDILCLTVDIDAAVQKAYMIGRSTDKNEQKRQNEMLARGETIDVSATVIKDFEPLYRVLKDIKSEIDVKKQDATVTFKYDNGPVYTYTDEKNGLSLDLFKTAVQVSAMVDSEKEVLTCALDPDQTVPTVKRVDIEKEYSLVGTYTTTLSANSSAGRIQNITTALEALDNRVWMMGETFSFNQWVGARTAEKGYGNGVFINADQQYDETIGGGICQVSTTIYYTALLCGGNSVGRNAPIEILERRPHTWPSVYIARGLDATISWPHTDLKMYNNSKTPYFMHNSITRKGSTLYVTCEIYGTPLPDNAKISIETETIEEITPPAPEYVIDTENKYNLAPNQQKLVTEARTGYTVNVYQVWSVEGKEPIKSLLTVSKYEPVQAKIYVGKSA